MPLLTVRDLAKTYSSRFGGPACRALSGVSLELDRGEFVAVMGPSGSGKTTLLNLVALIDRPDTGAIMLDGQDSRELRGDALSDFRRKRLGFVFQDASLIDTMTVAENIALPLALDRMSKAEIAARIDDLTSALGIDEILRKYPCETSGGQRQRAAAARALACRPSLLLADEPTGALDSKSGRDLMERFASLNEAGQAAILMVTHDPFAASWARRVVFLRDGQVFTEIRRGGERKAFFDRILEVQAAMEGAGR
jgi:ABC-type lipoprotein export system ATPase subunit